MRAPVRASLIPLLAAHLTFVSVELKAEEASLSEQAVQLGHDGLGLYESGKWDEAFARFEQANHMVFSPVFLLYMARCQRNAGRLREAVELFDDLLARDAGADAPAAWSNAVRDGRAELNALRRRIPSLRISSKGIASATLDGDSIPTEETIEVDPGEHVVRGWSKDGRLTLRRIVLSEGQKELPIVLSFEQVGPASVPQPVRRGEELSQEPAPGPSRTAFWITGGAAVGAAVLGTVTGLVARSRSDAIHARCDGNACPPELQDDAERARLLANVSTAAFGVAGVNLAFSVGFLLLSE